MTPLRIKNMTLQQLRKMRIKIDLEIHSREPEIDPELKLFYEVITKLLKEDTGKRYQPYFKYKDRNKLRLLHSEFQEWVNSFTTGKLNEQEWYNAYSLLYKVVKQELQSMQLPLSLKTFITVSGEFPAFFNQSFPDYVGAGIGHFIFKK